MHSTSAAAPAPSRVPQLLLANTFQQTRHVAPEERNEAETFVVTQPLHWKKAAPHVTFDDAPVARHQLAKSDVMAHMGQALGQAHRVAAKKSMPETALKTYVEAVQRWQSILTDKRLTRVSPIAPEEALVAIDELGQKLWCSTRERIFCTYNLTPAALRFQRDGSFSNAPESSASGFHAWFEPLARLDYTARGSFFSLSSLVGAYSDERTDVSDKDKESWTLDLIRSRALMNLLYTSYFLPKAYPAKKPGFGTIDDEGLVSLKEVLSRFQAEYTMLKVNKDLSASVRVHKPLEQRTI